jgi:hypothetical protein
MPKARIYYFNPTCELAVANGSFSYMPPLLLQKMERDLALLPFVFATKDDFLLAEILPSNKFIQQLKDWGFKVPKFRTLSELEAMPPDTFESICPWGWSPAAHFKLKNLKDKCSGKFKLNPTFKWQQIHQSLFERSTSLNFLIDILDNYQQSWFITKSLTGVKVTSIEEIEQLINNIQALVLKAPLSSSGRGIQIIRKNSLNNSNKTWISGVIKQQNYLIAEPLLEKLADLSFQFRITDCAEIDYLGFTFFETNSNGQYKGSFINHVIADFFPDRCVNDIEDMINKTAQIIGEVLKTSQYADLHRGFLGVDALIFQYEQQLRIQPCIEINCRMNMGILTLLIQNHICKEVKGKFELFYGQNGDFQLFAKREQELNPPVMKDGKISSGFFPLVEPVREQKFGAYFSVAGTK